MGGPSAHCRLFNILGLHPLEWVPVVPPGVTTEHVPSTHQMSPVGVEGGSDLARMTPSVLDLPCVAPGGRHRGAATTHERGPGPSCQGYRHCLVCFVL